MWGCNHQPAAFIKCPFTRQHLMSPGNSTEVPTSEFSLAQLCYSSDGVKIKDHSYIDTSLFCGKRAMVNNIFCRKIVRTWQQIKSDPPHPRVFTEPRCRNYAPTWYLIYRWFICLMWISIIVCSLGGFGGSEPKSQIHTWPIYLTNWDLVLGVSQSILGIILVTRRWSLQKASNGIDLCSIEYGKLEKLYWVLYSMTASIAVGVTVTYWVAVYNPKDHQIDPLNIMLHACNSILMLTDLVIVRIPLKFHHFWWSPLLVTIYLTFSLIYYLAGGLDKKGLHYIYKILDWKKPGITLLVVIGGVLFVVVIHCFLCYVTILLNRAFNNVKYVVESPTTLATEKGDKSRGLEIV